MDENVVALAMLQAAKDSAGWAFWSMIAAFISALATIATVAIATKALFSWKEQEKVKLRYSFKNSVHKYLSCLYILPDKLTEDVKAKQYEYVSRLMDMYDEANRNWIMLERMFDSTPIEDHWHSMSKLHNLYIRGNEKRDTLASECIAIIRNDMIFSNPKKI